MSTAREQPPGRLNHEPVVQVKGLNYHFGSGDNRSQVLFDISLEVKAGEMVILTGPTGCGKTTLLTLIGALRSIQEGEILVLGRQLRGMSRKDLVHSRRSVGFIFQLHNLFDSLSVYENVKLATDLADGTRREVHDRIVSLLTRLGLEQRLHYKPPQLSGGQRQRAAIARALVNRPRLILADEPTAALDKEAGGIVVELFQELAQENNSGILLVTHDKRILETASRIMNLLDGRMAAIEDLKEKTSSEKVL